MTETFVSYAQNAEDVVLWRVLGGVPHGFYVDVGAADPVVDSVTLAFSQRGWHGINVEPVPEFAERLRRERPADLCIEAAVGAAQGEVDLQVFNGTGWSTVDRDAAGVLAQREQHEFTTVRVPLRTLDSVLDEAGLDGRDIHFLKIDVEGLEEQVLLGTDLNRWRPWIVVVEATEPASTVRTDDRWEHLLLAAGYRCCLFDGLNRFYLSPEHSELAESLGYPACVFDQPYETAYQHNLVAHHRGEQHRVLDRLQQLEAELRHAHAVETAARGELDAALAFGDRMRMQAARTRQSRLELSAALIETRDDLEREQERARRLEFDLQDARTNVELIQQTVSWKVTSPLRAVRRAQRDGGSEAPEYHGDRVPPTTPIDTVVEPELSASSRRLLDAYALRVAQATALLAGETIPLDAGAGVDLDAFEHALASSDESIEARAWLALVAASGRYPDPAEVLTAARFLRRYGPALLVEHVGSRFENSLQAGVASDLGLDIHRGGVIVDIGHTASYDLLTGIQRVVREVATRWLEQRSATAVQWDFDANCLTTLEKAEVERFCAWRTHAPASGAELQRRTVENGGTGTVVPWHTTLLVPELAAEPARNTPYRAAAQAGVLARLALIGYDLIPMTAAETVTEGMSGVFALYLAMVKHADRVSAISETTAAELKAFAATLTGQGLSGPLVGAHVLPPGTPSIDPAAQSALSDRLDIGRDPLVLVVGSHEPRKFHLSVLEAAEVLWAQGQRFDLLFIGGSSWRSQSFDEEAQRLTGLGRPLHILKRATEDELWAAYELASFTVFPSLVEGYGLPIAESLACGTPVITSEFGAMEEVGRGGGAILLDPQDSDAMVEAMRSLLVDTDLLDRLRSEARRRAWKSWDTYADEVWEFLVG